MTLETIDSDSSSKPGPKTESAKAAVRLNAASHGMSSVSPVIPGLEREEDWLDFRAALLADLAPEGPLELKLAELAISALWRFRRVELYELGVTPAAREAFDQATLVLYRTGATSRWFEQAETRLQSLLQLAQLPDPTPFFGPEAIAAIEAACEYAGVDPDDPTMPHMQLNPRWRGFPKWTAGFTRRLIGDILRLKETESETESASSIEVLAHHFREQVDARRRSEHERLRNELMLPREKELRKFARYGAQLLRQFYQALHELEARQARRRGQAAPLARLDVTGLPSE
jgi:hypothetical protein